MTLTKGLISSLTSYEVLTEKVAEAQRMVDLAMAALSRARNTHRTVATSFDEAEADVKQGLRNVQQLVSSTAMATTGFSRFTEDRNEKNQL